MLPPGAGHFSAMQIKTAIFDIELATFAALLLGTFSQAAFTPVITRYRFGFTLSGKGLDILIQPYCLFLLLLFIVLNWSTVRMSK